MSENSQNTDPHTPKACKDVKFAKVNKKNKTM